MIQEKSVSCYQQTTTKQDNRNDKKCQNQWWIAFLGDSIIDFLANIGDKNHKQILMSPKFRATSMLGTDVGDEMCLWQLCDVGDGFGRSGRFHRYRNSVTNARKLSSTSTCRQHLCCRTSPMFFKLIDFQPDEKWLSPEPKLSKTGTVDCRVST